jgi:hypothetical protein
MHLYLTEEESSALLNLLRKTIEADRYPRRPAFGSSAASWRSSRWHLRCLHPPGRRHLRSVTRAGHRARDHANANHPIGRVTIVNYRVTPGVVPGLGEVDPVIPSSLFPGVVWGLALSRTDWLWSRTVSRW